MYRPSVGEWALGAILLHVHAKEANVHTINLLKGEKCFGSVGKGLRHFTRVHKPVVIKKEELLPCGRMPPPTSQVAVYIQVCPESYVGKTWKEFDERYKV